MSSYTYDKAGRRGTITFRIDPRYCPGTAYIGVDVVSPARRANVDTVRIRIPR